MITIISIILLVIGGLNWFLVGAFQFDLVSFISGGSATALARIIYILVGLSAIWFVGALTKNNGNLKLMNEDTTNNNTHNQQHHA